MYKDNIFQWAHSTTKKRHPEWNQVCPHCKRTGFSPLIDTRTERPVDDNICGICRHPHSCGYKMNYTEWKEKYAPPREWLPKDEWIALQRQREKEAEQIRRQAAERKANSFNAYAMTQPPKVQAYLDRMAALCKLMQVHNNKLVDYLYTIASKEQVDEVLNRYRIGSTKERKVIYWQIDRYERVRTGKIMNYGPDGHRIKSENANWVHCQKDTGLATKEQLAPQCLFGEHLIGELIANPPSDGENIGMGVVESEKSAIILSILCPDIVWFATGCLGNFKTEMLEVVKPYNVIVYPDADALDVWAEKIEILNREHGYRMYIPDWYRNMCTTEARAKKMDIADMMLERG